MKALQKASQAGQRIYHITQANMADVLPNIHHDGDTMAEIHASLNAGKEVITHTDAVSVPGWSGAGYIIIDPQVGDGAYKISGGGNGGLLALSWGSALLLFLASTVSGLIGPLVIALLIAVSILSNLILYWQNAECSPRGLEYFAYASIVALPFVAARGVEAIRMFLFSFFAVEGSSSGTNLIC